MVESVICVDQVPGLRSLIEAWCDRRCLKALDYVLHAYNSFNGQIDGWSMLCAAIRNARAFAHDELTHKELEVMCHIIRMAKESIDGSPSRASPWAGSTAARCAAPVRYAAALPGPPGLSVTTAPVTNARVAGEALTQVGKGE